MVNVHPPDGFVGPGAAQDAGAVVGLEGAAGAGGVAFGVGLVKESLEDQRGGERRVREHDVAVVASPVQEFSVRCVGSTNRDPVPTGEAVRFERCHPLVFPVFVAWEDQATLTFRVAVHPAYGLGAPLGSDDQWVDPPLSIKHYVHSVVRSRLHQGRFRIDVLSAYHERCCLCRLAHRELLDAAHIIPDSEPGGDPVVQNGLSLCKIHHAAFDQNFLGISPDHEVHVNKDLLLETDGPMLKHGIQELNGSRLVLPGSVAKRPHRERLEWRYERFRRAG